MAGAMKRFAEYLGLAEPTDGAYTEDDPRSSAGVVNITDQRHSTAVAAVPQRVVLPEAESAPVSQQPLDAMRITALQPRSYNDAKRIALEFRERVPVIVNLSDMADPDAKRVVDFCAGLTFGLHGKMDRIAKGVFLLTPANVEVGAELKAKMAQDGFFNQS